MDAISIVERLIDAHKISGKEACILIKAITSPEIKCPPVNPIEIKPYVPTPWITYQTTSTE